MKAMLLASVALAITPRAYNSDVCATVNIKGADGKPVRVNKADYDADQATDKPTMTLHADDAEQSAPMNVMTPLADGVIQAPAPSAPDFKGDGAGGANKTGAQVPNPPVDDATGAVMPIVPSPGQLLVLPVDSGKGNSKTTTYFVVDAAGAKITDRDGINADGYDTEQKAWDAILAQPH